MSNSLINALTAFFNYAVLAVGAQNVIFTRGLGLSNGLRIISNPRKDTLLFCISLTFFQLVNSVLCYYTIPFIYATPLAGYARFITPVVIVACCAFSYIVAVFLLSVLTNKKTFKKMVYSLTSASINSAIVGTIILSTGRGFNLVETVGFALGSSIGYFLAMMLISEGERKIRHDLVPQNFQGLPVTLIYISVLALAIYGLTGNAMVL
ncbi:MAG: NADH:ubiquinone oxidoreductase, subunit RnfA [Oscillospiraceae bacterium]|nr:NADH:ubiquinone oxidoreductase, subunit RnfA [Oscillospiraceae bacterium]